MKAMLAGLVGFMMMAATPAFAQCVSDAGGLPAEKLSTSAAMDVLNQIGGLNGLTGKWTTEGGSFDFGVTTGKVSVKYTIGKNTKDTTVTEVCKLDNTSLKVVATSVGKVYTVFMKITGNPGKILLGFAQDDLTEFVKK